MLKILPSRAQVIMKLYENEIICDNQVILNQMIVKHYKHEFTCDNQVILTQVIVILYEYEFTCDNHSRSSDSETE